MKHDKSTPARRHRGVRASRVKLARAMTNAGLKTQVSLAERIADIEGLEAAPKDVVNRVFRELPVDVTTLDRVANALGVDAYSLYKTSDEDDIDTPPARPGAGRPRMIRFAAAIAAVGAAAVWLTLDTDLGGDAAEPGAAPTLDLGGETLVVMELTGDDGRGVSTAIRESLSGAFNVASATASALTRTLDPGSAADRLRADAVIDGDIVHVGRLTAARVYLYAGGVRRQIWAESWPESGFARRIPALAERVSIAVRAATGIPARAPRHFPLEPVQDDYLEGELHLDQPASELNVKRAQSRFEAALRQDANYALAHAGLCQTLLEEHWMSDEERALTDAARACGRAIQLDPGHPAVAAAHAHFLRRTGRNDEALALYERTIEDNPDDAALLYGLSNSRLAAYRQSGDDAFLQAAKDAAVAATDADAGYWKAPFGLATMEWFDGNLSGAIAAAEIALARHENEMILSNLGSFYLCEGSFEKARDIYARAQTLNPTSYVGDEFLGQAYYFLGDFRRSAELRQRAIDRIATGAPEIHEMWGNLGESYRRTGNAEKAIAAFVRAAEIAERDYLRGTAPIGDQAARAYYYVSLAALDTGRVPAAVLGEIADEIDGFAAELTSASEHRRMALTYLLLGDRQKARTSLQRATSTCPGYGRMPDLAVLDAGTGAR